ncbi:MAG: cyclic nucleotide-binding domain-containing protein [Chloroflexi bacterium]|nr:cyclic nucleotide-binding domain-containing protein [Chloroflexota bacterium]
MFENKPKFGPQHFSANSIIIRQGDEPDRFYIITRGLVDVVDQPPDGLDERIAELGPGDYFGEVGMIRRRRRMATVRTKTDVDAMVMDYQTFRSWIDNSPEVAAELDSVIEERLSAADDLTEPLPEEWPSGMLCYLENDAAEQDTTADTATYISKGQTIIKQGETADTFYVIIEGFVTVTHAHATGREQTIAYLTSGDYFGEIGLLDGRSRIATVIALTNVKLLSFDRDTFKSWMRMSPGSQDDLQREAKRRLHDTGLLTQPDSGQ